MSIRSTRVGEKFLTKQGCIAEIIEYFGSNNVTVRFEDGTILYKYYYRNLILRQTKNPNFPSFYGIGYLGQGKYSVKNHKIIHSRWVSIFQRCYGESYINKYPSYKECSISKEWHNFQNFAKWYEENYIKGCFLSRSSIITDNKMYSPEMCRFIPINKEICRT